MSRGACRFIPLVLVLSLVITAETASSQTVVDGAWEVTYAVNDSLDSNQAGLYIFQGGYYSVLHVWADAPRPLYEEGEARDNVEYEKLLSIILPVEGNSGRFQIEGSTLTMTPMVAISPNFMRGQSRSYSFSVSGDELTLRGGTVSGNPLEINRVLRLRRLR